MARWWGSVRTGRVGAHDVPAALGFCMVVVRRSRRDPMRSRRVVRRRRSRRQQQQQQTQTTRAAAHTAHTLHLHSLAPRQSAKSVSRRSSVLLTVLCSSVRDPWSCIVPSTWSRSLSYSRYPPHVRRSPTRRHSLACPLRARERENSKRGRVVVHFVQSTARKWIIVLTDDRGIIATCIFYRLISGTIHENKHCSFKVGDKDVFKVSLFFLK